jgi:hypothetical protein
MRSRACVSGSSPLIVAVRGAACTGFVIAPRGLVPGGVYSLFYRTFGPASDNASCPDVQPGARC